MLAKAQARIQELYGVDNVGRLDATKEKIRSTNIEKFGVENPFSASGVKLKIRETMLQRYGAENPSLVPAIREKVQKTFDLRYQGNPQRDPGVREKTRKTNEGRYGGPAPLCDEVILRKAIGRSCRAGVELRPFVFPSGRTVMVQGYEGDALCVLLEAGHAEEDIVVGKEVPSVRYRVLGDKERTYHPDIFIKSLNRLIEVKSLWTFQRGKSRDGLGLDNPTFERNMAKAQAAKLAGFDFHFMLKHNDGHWSTF